MAPGSTTPGTSGSGSFSRILLEGFRARLAVELINVLSVSWDLGRCLLCASAGPEARSPAAVAATRPRRGLALEGRPLTGRPGRLRPGEVILCERPSHVGHWHSQPPLTVTFTSEDRATDPHEASLSPGPSWHACMGLVTVQKPQRINGKVTEDGGGPGCAHACGAGDSPVSMSGSGISTVLLAPGGPSRCSP